MPTVQSAVRLSAPDFIQHPRHEILYFGGSGFAHGIHMSQSTFVFDFGLPELGK
jgi:hypothetical protein